jgi:adenylate cyclase
MRMAAEMQHRVAELNAKWRNEGVEHPFRVRMGINTGFCNVGALVRDIVVAHALPPITMKGISREVIPYSVEGMLDTAGQKIKIFSEHLTGLDFYLDPSMIHAGSAGRIRALLQDAIAALENYGQSSRPDKPIA